MGLCTLASFYMSVAIISGLFSTGVNPHTIAAGPYPAICGIIGGWLVLIFLDYFEEGEIHTPISNPTSEKRRLSYMYHVVTFSCFLGLGSIFFPRMDAYANLGGFLSGFSIMAILRLGQAALEENRSLLGWSYPRYALLFVASVTSVAVFLIGFVGAFVPFVHEAEQPGNLIWGAQDDP